MGAVFGPGRGLAGALFAPVAGVERLGELGQVDATLLWLAIGAAAAWTAARWRPEDLAAAIAKARGQ